MEKAKPWWNSLVTLLQNSSANVHLNTQMIVADGILNKALRLNTIS